MSETVRQPSVAVLVKGEREAKTARRAFPGARIVREGNTFCGWGWDVLLRTYPPTDSEWERADLMTRAMPAARVVAVDLAAFREAGTEGLADLDRRDACARASLGSGEVRKGVFSYGHGPEGKCSAFGCGVMLGGPRDGADHGSSLCSACLDALDTREGR